MYETKLVAGLKLNAAKLEQLILTSLNALLVTVMPEKAVNNIVPMRNGKCPICSKRWDRKYRPFCSKRCADLDLSKWLNEAYRIPADEAEELDDDAFIEE